MNKSLYSYNNIKCDTFRSIALFLFLINKSHSSKRFSDGNCSLFTPGSRPEVNRLDASTSRQNRLKIADTCHFVFVNGNNISELIGGGGGGA